MPTKRYGRFKVKKIKKRMISAVLALSMGMTLMPTDFTGFRAYATNKPVDLIDSLTEENSY